RTTTDHVGPDAPVRAGERSSPENRGASLRRADEGVRPYACNVKLDRIQNSTGSTMPDSIHIKLPDGSTKEVAKGATALDVAKSISPRLADAALAAKTNGNLIDLTRPLEQDTDL